MAIWDSNLLECRFTWLLRIGCDSPLDVFKHGFVGESDGGGQSLQDSLALAPVERVLGFVSYNGFNEVLGIFVVVSQNGFAEDFGLPGDSLSLVVEVLHCQLVQLGFCLDENLSVRVYLVLVVL